MKQKRHYEIFTFASGVEVYYTADHKYAYLEVDGDVVMRVTNDESAYRRAMAMAWDVSLSREWSNSSC